VILSIGVSFLTADLPSAAKPQPKGILTQRRSARGLIRPSADRGAEGKAEEKNLRKKTRNQKVAVQIAADLDEI
jgi:hypothetical protein